MPDRALSERLQVVERLLDDKLMTQKALKTGLDKDPVFLERLAEYQKVKLVNIRRGQLLADFEADGKALEQFFNDNKKRIAQPESRNIQMVVLKTRHEAEGILQKITAGKMTIHEAAKNFSIDPNAKKTLGVIGWVSKGTGFPALDTLSFSLDKDKIGGPVKSKAGWHLVKVLDIRDAMYVDFNEMNTWERTRRIYLHERLGDYVANLRLQSFTVEVDDDFLKRT